MKFDKETLLKNKFWVVLAAAAPLALITIFVLTVFVSSAIAKKKGELDKKEKTFTSVPDTPNDKNIEEWQKLAAEQQARKAKVWKEAWDAQKVIYQWPKAFEDKYQFNSGYFATEVKIDGTESEGDYFAGRIVNVDELTQEWIEVENKEGKRRFRKTPNVVVADPAKKINEWQKLQGGKEGPKVSVKFHQFRNFYDPLTEAEYLHYIKTYKEKGEKLSPLWQIINLVNPVREIPEEVKKKKDEGDKKEGPALTISGVVLLGNAPLKYNEDARQNSLPAPMSKFFRYVAQWTNNGDISEDVWLAQEDLWIQKELFYRIKLANESISNFELVAVDGAPPSKKKGKDKEKNTPLTHEQIVELNTDKAGAPFTFKNPYWQLELKLVKGGKLEYKLVNLLPRRQKLNVEFMVRLNDTDPKMEKLVVGGTTLDPKPPEGAKEKDVKQEDAKEEDSYFKTGTFDVDKSKDKDRTPPPQRTGIYAVEQVLTSETAAVKRIDMISIGDTTPDESSHSHRTFPEKLRSFKEEKKEVVEKKDDPPVGGDPNPLMRGADKGAVRKTENGLLKDRYLDVTSEGSRRIPVAIVLIVDQEQIDRVLTSFRNSPMRFLTTQVILNRYPHALQVATGQAQGAQPPPQFGIRPPREFNVQPRVDPALLVGQGASESNVELVIYGQITLYNRLRETPAAQTPKQ